jgi:hypothetical protein
MRLLFHILSLVLLNPVAVVVSTEIPLPSHKDALQRIHAKNKERSLRNQDRISRFLSHVRTDDQPLERNLQTSAPTSDSICNADGSTNFMGDDDFNVAVFGGAKFDTVCNCTDGTSTVVTNKRQTNICNVVSIVGCYITRTKHSNEIPRYLCFSRQ